MLTLLHSLFIELCSFVAVSLQRCFSQLPKLPSSRGAWNHSVACAAYHMSCVGGHMLLTALYVPCILPCVVSSCRVVLSCLCCSQNKHAESTCSKIQVPQSPNNVLLCTQRHVYVPLHIHVAVCRGARDSDFMDLYHQGLPSSQASCFLNRCCCSRCCLSRCCLSRCCSRCC